MIGEPLLTAQEVADLLNVRRAWVYTKAREGALKSYAVGKHLRFKRTDVSDFVDHVARL